MIQPLLLLLGRSGLGHATTIAMKLLVHVVVLFELLVCVLSDCPIYGCTPSASFTSEAKHFNTSTAVPQPVWSKGIPDLTPTGAGCVTNGGRVICPFTGKNG